MFRRSVVLTLAIVVLCVVSISGCSSDKKNDGFETTKTDPTVATEPSDAKTISQPCSLITLETASTILNTPQQTLGEPESSEPSLGTLRCRYGATSQDGELFLVLNVYVFTTQEAYDLVKKVNKGEEIETSFDAGFTFDKTTTTESEIFVAAIDGTNRVGVSASIATTKANTPLEPSQINLPDINDLANQVGVILYEL